MTETTEKENLISIPYAKESQERLDQFLTASFKDYSRSFFQKLIEQKAITINGKPAQKPAQLLKPHDIVEICFPESHECSVKPQAVDFELIDVQDDFIITNKPAGLLVHHACNNPDEKTLVSGVMHRFKELEQFEEKDRPGIVHRIDKDTSGLVIVTRTIPGQIEFSRKFQDRKVSKIYLAIVSGLPPAKGSINYPISRSIAQPHKMTHTSALGRSALTHYRTIAYYNDAALVEVSIVTGRTHQIRVHFAAISHPLLGDTVYGEPSALISRQALHAWKVSFEHKGKFFSYRAKPPKDFLDCLFELNRNKKNI